MKALLAAALVALAVPAFAAPYFQFIDPAHPQLSAGADFHTKDGSFDSAVTKVALVYHAGDPNDSIVPKSAQKWIPPTSWSPLSVGASYGNGSGNLVMGPSINLEPQVLGWALPLLQKSKSRTAKVVSALIGGHPQGGIAFGLDWNARVIQSGTIMPLNRWGFTPDYFIGALWRF